MAEIEEKVFEISDFTSVTEWERFIARIEEIIQEWKLTTSKVLSLPPVQKGELSRYLWREQREFVNFAKFRFLLTHYFAVSPSTEHSPTVSQKDSSLPEVLSALSNQENDFPLNCHPISYWYGLRNFLVLHPAEAEEAIATEDRAKLLLSSLGIALNNTTCTTAAFVQLWERGNKLYVGVSQEQGIRTSFESVYLYRTPQQYQHLAGLLTVFKSKMVEPITSVMVTTRYKYVLRDWSLDSWPQAPIDVDDLGENIQPKDFGILTIGALEDPVVELVLYTCWPQLSADGILDNELYSDLCTSDANLWTACIGFAESPACSLADCLLEFAALSRGLEAHERLIGGVIDGDPDDSSEKAAKVLSRLTSATGISSLGDVVAQAHRAGKRAIRRRQNPRRLAVGLQNPTLSLKILQFIFPDALTPTPEDDAKTILDNSEEEEDYIPDDALLELLRSLKSAPEDSLTWRLTLALAKVNLAFGGLEAVAKLWNHFLQEVTYRWETNSLLPSLSAGPPDLACSLLHQKFQMLNYCIERRKLGESQSTPHISSEESEDEDDEFFECIDEVKTQEKGSSSPEGRLRQLGNILLQNGKSPLYIPVTQEPAPLTEDGLAEQADALVRLGTDKDGAALRAKMQSTCLTSDMEAFKAANPDSVLEDFVRWYSPRDWVEGDEDETEPSNEIEKSSGHLSNRMMVPGNLWKEAWETARPIPARRQKRLFDETKEAEMVLHFLGNLTPSQVVNHLFSVLVHAATLQLDKAAHRSKQSVKPMLMQAIKMAVSSHNDQEIINCLYRAELRLAQIQSLKTKFKQSYNEEEEEFEENEEVEEEQPALTKFIQQLVEKPMVHVPGAAKGQIGRILTKLFKETEELYNPTALGKFPKPSEREFILRTNSKRPQPGSPGCLLQKMYAMLGSSEFRLCCAFSEETTFMFS